MRIAKTDLLWNAADQSFPETGVDPQMGNSDFLQIHLHKYMYKKLFCIRFISQMYLVAARVHNDSY